MKIEIFTHHGVKMQAQFQNEIAVRSESCLQRRKQIENYGAKKKKEDREGKIKDKREKRCFAGLRIEAWVVVERFTRENRRRRAEKKCRGILDIHIVEGQF